MEVIHEVSVDGRFDDLVPAWGEELNWALHVWLLTPSSIKRSLALPEDSTDELVSERLIWYMTMAVDLMGLENVLLLHRTFKNQLLIGLSAFRKPFEAASASGQYLELPALTAFMFAMTLTINNFNQRLALKTLRETLIPTKLVIHACTLTDQIIKEENKLAVKH